MTDNKLQRVQVLSGKVQILGPERRFGNDYLTIDPRRSVLIGDLGIDMPLALDYQLSDDNPRVLYLPSYASGWIEVAPDISTLLSKIRRG
jgi:hypothetical protein